MEFCTKLHEQVTPDSAALLANRASAAAEQCLGQAAPSAAAWSALAACTTVLEAACARGRLDLDDATSLRLHMEVTSITGSTHHFQWLWRRPVQPALRC